METSAAPVLDDSQLPTPVDSFVGVRAKPEEFRASLESVRVAQDAARARARRETLRARIIVVGLMATAGAVAWNVSLRRKHNPRPAIASAAAPSAVPSAVSSVTPSGAAEAPPPAQPTPAEAAPVVAASAIPATPDLKMACDTAFAERRWSSVATACAAAFKVHPLDGELAMRVADAQNRRGYLADAGHWARNAIEVDGNFPEAFVILARAEARAGHPQAAATAYRGYLSVAPRGWHSAEARGALARSEGRRAKPGDSR